MTDREFVLKAVSQMPADASFQHILRELNETLMAESIKRKILESDTGKPGVPHEEVEKLLPGWIREAQRKGTPGR